MKKLLFFLSLLLMSTSFINNGNALIRQVTRNTTTDHYPSLYNGTIAWVRWEGGNEVYYWDGSTTVHIGQGSDPSLCNGTIAWQGSEGIYYWDGITTSHIGNGSYPSLYEGTLAYQNNGKIYYWNGTSTIEVGSGERPSLYDGTIAWQAHDGNDMEIHFWDGVNTTQISDNDVDDEEPSLYNGTIAWIKSKLHPHQVVYWDGNTTVEITNDPDYPRPRNSNIKGISCYDGTVAWSDGAGHDNMHLFYWDGITIRQITNDISHDMHPSLHNGSVAWVYDGGGDREILYWDGGSTVFTPDPSVEVNEIRPSYGGYGTRIRIMGVGLGDPRSGMVNGDDGYYSFVSFTSGSLTMIGTKYPPGERNWNDTRAVLWFKKLFVDANGNYVQDFDEGILTEDEITVGDYDVAFNTVFFHDFNQNGVFDASDEVYDTVTAGPLNFTLTDAPVINKLVPNAVLPSEAGSSQFVIITGQNFGSTQGQSMVHVGSLTWPEGKRKIRFWRDKKIKIKIPSYKCNWITADWRRVQIWVTVNGLDSNKVRLEIIKPDNCP